MYLAVDVGGSKTLVASTDDNGVIVEKYKFPTPDKYQDFLQELQQNITNLKAKDFIAAGMGVPVTNFDRDSGTARTFSNLPWRNVTPGHDLRKIINCPVVLENDAKLAALSEYMMLKEQYSKVLYVTVSTGIGIGLVVDGTINRSVGDAGGRGMMLEHKGKLTDWESFASGKAIAKRWGLGKDIHDPVIWQKIAHNLSLGLVELVALIQPEVIVFGGSVGVFFDRFGDALTKELKKYQTPLIDLPKLLGAKRPEDAVVYGCYDIAQQTYGSN